MSAAILAAKKAVVLKHIANLVDCLVNIQDETGEFLMTLEDGRVIDTKGWNDWEVRLEIRLINAEEYASADELTVDPRSRYGRVSLESIAQLTRSSAAGLYGLWKRNEVTGDEDALAISLAWFKERFAVGTTKNVNTMSPLLVAAYLHEAKRANYHTQLDAWAEWVMYDMPRTEEGGLQHMTYLNDHHQQLWDDTLMMCVLPLAKIGLVLGRNEYVEEAKRQFLLHIKYLADPQTGLWYHGECFDALIDLSLCSPIE